MASTPRSAARGATRKRAAPRSAFFPFAIAIHGWDPKNQRPELWRVYNTRINKGESIRVFPLSNWTELDIWQYILAENIPIVPLYFAAKRPVVARGGTLIMRDDDRMKLLPGEEAGGTAGPVPHPGLLSAHRRDRKRVPTRLEAIVTEMFTARTSERQGRLIDGDEKASMEKKKREGYF